MPSAGGGVDNVRFSFSDVEAKVNELERSGVKIVERPRMIPGPSGVRIQIVDHSAHFDKRDLERR